jgi:LysR family hydrogen peroxide-inducible transcriptional activator
VLLSELADGRLDVVFLALPVVDPDLESLALIEDKFLLVVPRQYRSKGRVVVTEEFIRQRRLLLLEEGHCFREQALSYCGLQQSSALNTLGASTFATIVRMVANGLGVTFLPEMAIATEARNNEIRLLRLAEPEPKRTLGLVWRKTSPRKRDFAELGKVIGKLKLNSRAGPSSFGSD